MWAILFQTGQTFNEHSDDMYPMLLYIIVVLLATIISMMIAYVKENRKDMAGLKDGQTAFNITFNKYLVNYERRIGHIDKRLTLVEDRIGMQISREPIGDDE